MKSNRLSYILIVLGIAVGLFLTAQWKVPQVRSSDPIAPYLSLRNTRNDLVKEQTGSKKEITALQKAINVENSKQKGDAQLNQLIYRSQTMKDQVGLTDKSGSGLIITLNDSSGGPGTIDNIAHAADLRDIVNVLWQNGAEAISINGERVVMNTSIDCIVNTILINNTKTTPPFKIVVIGDSYKLKGALQGNYTLADLWKRVKNDGVILTIDTSWRVTVKTFNGSFVLHYATKAGAQ